MTPEWQLALQAGIPTLAVIAGIVIEGRKFAGIRQSLAHSEFKVDDRVDQSEVRHQQRLDDMRADLRGFTERIAARLDRIAERL